MFMKKYIRKEVRVKTVTCDICGRTQEALLYKGARINHFKKRKWEYGQGLEGLWKFDICDLCLHELRERMRKEEGGRINDH